MNKPLIKICGVLTPQFAKALGDAGIDYIGIVFHPSSKRFVNLNLAKKISHAAKESGTVPVAIFVDHHSAEMNEICHQTDINVIQLHGKIAKNDHHLMSKDYKRFYVQPVLSTNDITSDQDNGLAYCDPKRDFLLFDHSIPGKGNVFNWNEFKYSGQFPFGIAGGLSALNVSHAINKFKPALVDVSSGVENLFGEKDISLVKQFIEVVRNRS